MSVILTRLDDRLVHGQVTVGWLPALEITRIVLISDEVAGDEWEQAIYQGATPSGIEIRFLSVTEAARVWRDGAFDDARTLCLVETPRQALELAEAGAPLHSLNIGGLHHRHERKKILSFVFVDDDDLICFRALHQRHIELECRDTPGADTRLLTDLLPL